MDLEYLPAYPDVVGVGVPRWQVARRYNPADEAADELVQRDTAAATSMPATGESKSARR